MQWRFLLAYPLLERDRTSREENFICRPFALEERYLLPKMNMYRQRSCYKMLTMLGTVTGRVRAHIVATIEMPQLLFLEKIR